MTSPGGTSAGTEAIGCRLEEPRETTQPGTTDPDERVLSDGNLQMAVQEGEEATG